MGSITVKINGEAREIPKGLNVAGLLQFLTVDPSRVAIELDRALIRKAKWDEARVEDGAEIEIVMFVGGG